MIHPFRPRGLALLLITPLLAFWPGSSAEAKSYQPPPGKTYIGVSDTGQTSDFREFQAAVRHHPAVIQSFESWGYYPTEAAKRWDDTRTRGMLSLSTSPCYGCPEVISPGQIARGLGDGYILNLGRRMASLREPVYIRLMPEMNGHWNEYSAFHGNGGARDRDHSTKMFRKAWRRFTLIIRGGKTREVNRALRKNGMPGVKGKNLPARLKKPKVAMLWVPQSSGSPNTAANAPRAYFPGRRFVDWVGADIYGKYPNFAGLNDLYGSFRKVPFMIGEWSPWGVDSGAFVNKLFGWAKRHKRTRMLVYYQDFGEGNEHEIQAYPESKRALRITLNAKRFLPFAPENEIAP